MRPADWSVNTLKDFTNVPARTPGGVAWKLATALDYWSGEENWEWWRYMLQSAYEDATDLERLRQWRRKHIESVEQKPTGSENAVFLAERWAELRRRFGEIPDTAENQETRGRLLRRVVCNE